MIHPTLHTTAFFLCILLAPAMVATASADPPKPGSTQQLEQFNQDMAQKAAACPLKAEPAFKDFGFVGPNTLVEMTAKIVNPLDKPVKCIASKPTCQCTTVDMVGKVIPAGGSITVPVSMKTTGSTGQKVASVHMIFETAPGIMVPGILELKLRAEVAYPVRGVQLNPRKNGPSVKDSFVNAFDFPEQVKGEITVESIDGKSFHVMSVMGRPPVFVDFNPAADAARTIYRVRYDLSGIPCAEIPKYLIIETDRPDATLIEMRVRHECTKIEAQYAFAQYYENLGVLPQGVAREFNVEIKHANGVQINAVTSSDPRLKVELLGAASDGDSLLVKLRVTPQPGEAGVITVPLIFTGVGPDPKQPAPPGAVPVGVLPRSSAYLVFYKSVPAATPATPALQSGATAQPASR